MIIALAGRRVDAANADTPRFPLANADEVKERIRQTFKTLDATAIVSAAACGADLLAQEVAMEMGLRRRVVLALSVREFRDASVTDRPGEWGPRYDEVITSLTRPKDKLITMKLSAADDTAWEQNNGAILDEAEAIARGRKMDPKREVVVVVVWDGHSRGESDLTEQFMREGEQRGLRVETVLTL